MASLSRLRVIRGALALAVLLVLAGITLAALGEARTSADRRAGTSKTCPVTVPNRMPPPSAARSALPPVPPVFHGNGKVWVKLWPLGVIAARPVVVTANGSIDIKLPWWRKVPGRLTITGKRLDGQAPRLRSNIPAGYGTTGFQATGVIFPTQGCWKVIGRVGATRLVFVTLVVKPNGNGY